MDRVYLDHAATTPLAEPVLEAMMPHLTEQYANASSVHALGRRSRHVVEESRERVAEHLGAGPGEIVFTSGGTEADNLAIKGVLAALPDERPGLLTSRAEHKAVRDPAFRLRDRGLPVELLAPDSAGRVDPDRLDAALTEREGEIGLVSLMYVNNELGTVNPVRDLAAVCRDHDVLLHCDAVQAPGFLPLDVEELGVDLLSLSAHKFYGPKGIGVLCARGYLEIEPIVEGGGQERGRRGGTENVAAIVGLAEALGQLDPPDGETGRRIAGLRDRLLERIRRALDSEEFVVNTPLEEERCDRIDEGRGARPAAAPHVLNLAFPPRNGEPVDGEMLLLNMDMTGICASNGSACTSGAMEPSHVLEAIGLPAETASAALRFSLGKETSPEEVDAAAEAVGEVLGRMRA